VKTLRVVEASKLTSEEYARIVSRGALDLSKALKEVEKVVVEVKEKGDEALKRFSKEFDGVEVDLERWSFKVDEEEVKEAYREVGEEALEAIRRAVKNVKKYHEARRPTSFSVKVEEGVIAGSLIKPLSRVGVYVPRGRSGYPSTAIMTVVPAKVAGVKEVLVCTPPLRNGKAPTLTLVAAIEAGASQVFKVGGAHAIAAMAYGTETIPKVDKIVGPGGLYVTAAKLLVNKEVAIDLPAGPSEVLVIADDSADPAYIALDLLAQAEHDPASTSILVTTSKELAIKVVEEIDRRREAYPKGSAERERLDKSLEERGWIIVVESLDEAVKIVNDFAPEHVEFIVKDPLSLLGAVRNAGSMFMGEYSPTAIGDYAAGPSHVLPTGGYAKVYSGLSTRDFVKEVGFINCNEEGMKRIGWIAAKLAELEGFKLHALSVEERLRRLKPS